MPMNHRPRRSAGFTLIELMVTILIVAVLVAIGVPSFRNAIQRNRVATANNDLLAGLAYARTTAIYGGQLVSMCPSTDGLSCASSPRAFEPGWIVYTYPAGAASANKPYVAASATLLRSSGAHEGVSINAQQTPVITFGLQGQLRNAAGLVFLTCARNGSSGLGTSTSSVPGVRMEVNSSGSIMSTAVAPAGSCGS